MSTFVTLVHLFTCFLLVVLVLLQSGKGAEISASLGGSSQTVFGSSGGANFFSRTTAVLAAVFFCTSIGLTLLGGAKRKSLFERMGGPHTTTSPISTAPTKMPADPTAAKPNAAAPAAPSTSAAPVEKK